MILEITASANGGFCGACVKTRGLRYRLRQIRSVFEFLRLLLVMPFMALRWGIRIAWRRWRFPYDRSTLREAIWAAMPHSSTTLSYLNGVVEGYWDSTPEDRVVFTSDRAHQYGTEDGGRLRRGEIAVSDIPTRRPPWLSEANFEGLIKVKKT